MQTHLPDAPSISSVNLFAMVQVTPREVYGVGAFGFPSPGNGLSMERQNFDCRGNVFQKTDAEGYVFTTSYAALNRSKVVTGPPTVSHSGPQKVTPFTMRLASGSWISMRSGNKTLRPLMPKDLR